MRVPHHRRRLRGAVVRARRRRRERHGGRAAGVYNVVDDEPEAAAEWVPSYARALGVKAPRHVPVGLAKLLAGKSLVTRATSSRGADNAKAKALLAWKLQHAELADRLRADGVGRLAEVTPAATQGGGDVLDPAGCATLPRLAPGASDA